MRKDATVGLDQRNRLGLTDRLDAGSDDANGFVDRQHRSAEGEAVVR